MTQEDLDNLAEEHFISLNIEYGHAWTIAQYQSGFKKALELVFQTISNAPYQDLEIGFIERDFKHLL